MESDEASNVASMQFLEISMSGNRIPALILRAPGNRSER